MIKIEWDKVFTNAVSALVVATFMGAAAIVWKGATTVDTKVQQTRTDMEHLINTLSDQLSTYQSQLTSFSNQLAAFSAHAVTTTGIKPEMWKPEPEKAMMQQQQYRNEIYNQLKK